jgi:hypothetical protein
LAAAATLAPVRISLSASGSMSVSARQTVRARSSMSSATNLSMLSTVHPPILFPTGALAGSVRPVASATSATGGPRMTGGTSRTGTAQGGTG